MPKKSSLFILAFLLATAGLRADNIVDQIIARVDNAIITRADFEKGKQAKLDDVKQRFPNDWQSKWAGEEKDTLRDLIDQQLLLEKGKDLGITGETETIKRLDEYRKSMNLKSMEELEEAAKQQGVSYQDFKETIRTGIVTSQVLVREVGSRIHPTQEEVQQFYEEHKKELESPEAVKLSEIIISTQPKVPQDKDKTPAPSTPVPEDPATVAAAKAKADQILDQLRKGANFEEMARKNSDASTAADGGALGVFKRGELDKQLEDKTFSLKAGEVSDVIKIKQGFIIFKVLEHTQAGVPPLKDVEDRIRDAVYMKKMEPAARAYLTKLRGEAFVDVREGYVDTGANPNQKQQITMAAAGSGDVIKNPSAKEKKKKKHFLLF